MPLPWFRRRSRHSETESTRETPPPEQKETAGPAAAVAEAHSAAPDGQDAARRRRHRGSRGGKGRKRPATTSQAAANGAEAPAKTATKPKPKPDAAAKPARAGKRAKRSEPRRRQQRRQPLPQAKRELLVSVNVTEQRVAVLEDDRLAEVYLERPGRRSIAGNVYKGVVDNVLPGMEAAFVEIGLEKNGFLYVDEIVGPELEGKRHGRRIQDLLSRGQEILVQAVKDPMKTKGARLTTEISLPGRFVVYVPQGEGIGVSRRLEDEERIRLREILKKLDLPKGGVIVRTAAEGASEEDIERDIRFLEKIWKEIQARAKKVPAPSLVYHEAELPLRVVRDLFTGDFEKALVDDDLTYKRIVGYLKKTSPHMAERVVRYREKEPLFEVHGVESEIRSTLSRRVDLPSGGYLVFDYAEAFTVVDVNTGRFVGSRSKSSGGRLEDTITKNNLEAVKEVVRQLRLRDIGGIIVIDFIDMANPKNRELVEEELKQELERDRTKTYVVEISPLGLVEMTRQNVTDGPREILTKRCPTCAGDGIVVSETTSAVDAERRLRALAAQSPRDEGVQGRAQPARRVGADRPGRRRAQGDRARHEAACTCSRPRTARRSTTSPSWTRAASRSSPPSLPSRRARSWTSSSAKSGCTTRMQGWARSTATTCASARRHGSSARRSRSASSASSTGRCTRRSSALRRRPSRRRSRRRAWPRSRPAPARAPSRRRRLCPDPRRREQRKARKPRSERPRRRDGEEPAPGAPRKRTRRGSRGGRRRRKPATAAANGSENGVVEAEQPEEADEPGPRIHLPDPSLGTEAEELSDNGAQPARKRRSRSRRRPAGTTGAAEITAVAEEETAPQAEMPEATAPGADEGEAPKRKKSRRGSRGGRRRKKSTTAAAEAPSES